MDNELIVQEKVESMLSYFCTCKHMNITMGVWINARRVSSEEKNRVKIRKKSYILQVKIFIKFHCYGSDMKYGCWSGKGNVSVRK